MSLLELRDRLGPMLLEQGFFLRAYDERPELARLAALYTEYKSGGKKTESMKMIENMLKQVNQKMSKPPRATPPSHDFVFRTRSRPTDLKSHDNYVDAKVWLTVRMPALNGVLMPAARQRLVALLGDRYDAESDSFTLIAHRHRTALGNKWLLKKWLKELVAEACNIDPLYVPLDQQIILDAGAELTVPKKFTFFSFSDIPSQEQYVQDRKYVQQLLTEPIQ
jgi:hypothetical protein